MVIRRIVVSPHLDDAVLSLGASLHGWRRQGDDVIVATVFAGTRLLERTGLVQRQMDLWGIPRYEERRREDRRATALLDVQPVHGDLPELLLRAGAAHSTIRSLLQHRDGRDTVEILIGEIMAFLQPLLTPSDCVYLPAGQAAHPDHRLVRAACERLDLSGARYYEELPYSADDPVTEQRLIVNSESLEMKLCAVEAYRSQIGVLFGDVAGMRRVLTGRAALLGADRRYAEGFLPRDRLW